MTSGSDALLVLYNGLAPEEQDDAYERVTEQRLSADTATEDDMERYLRSLRRVAEYLGRFPKTMEYKAAALELIGQGEDVETFARVYARFGSWHRAREAVGMAEVSSPLRVESRFKQRRHGRPYRFTNAQLAETLERAVADLGGVPTTSDFMWWRRIQLEQANARGDHDHSLPALSAYRRRWGTWPGALAGCGYTEQQIFDRLGSVTGPPSLGASASNLSTLVTLPVAELNDHADIAGGLSATQTDKLRTAWLQLPQRTRHIITVRLGLQGDRPSTFVSMGPPLRLSASRARQLHHEGVDELVAAVKETQTPRDSSMRKPVEAALRHLSRTPLATRPPSA